VHLVVVERDNERYAAAVEQGLPTIHGDATDEEILLKAGVTRAATLVISMPSDADNVFITLTARNLSSEIQIISRAESPSTARKLKQAGASRVVLPTVSGAKMMARMITRPTTAELIELVAETPLPHMELDELRLNEHSPLVGVDVREAEANKKHRLLVVSVKRPDGQMLFNPEGDYRFQFGDTVVLLGKHEDIARFKDQMGPKKNG
jgi:voltage-gated potassium channel